MGKNFHTLRARVSPSDNLALAAKAQGISINRFLLNALRKGLDGMNLVVQAESIRGREDDKHHDTVEQIERDQSAG